MSLVYESTLANDTGYPGEIERAGPEQRLDVAVVFTSTEATAKALKDAGAVAGALKSRITLVVAQVVPWPLELTSPPVLYEFNEPRFRVLASRTGVPTSVSIYLCRDKVDTLCRVLRHGSMIMICGRKRWWPTPEKRLAWKLRREGHQVIYTELED
jgi:hypothetical protein